MPKNVKTDTVPDKPKEVVVTTNLGKENRFSYKHLIPIVAAMVAIGGYFIYHSFASAVAPANGANDVVLDYKFAGPSGSSALISEFVPIRVYGNGLAICGNDSPADSGKTAAYYQKQLTPDELQGLVTKVVNTGFLNYKQPSNAVVFPNSENSISLNLKDGLYKIPYYNIGQKPAAFSATEAVIKDFCNGLTTPYTPAKAVVYSRPVVNGSVATLPQKPADVQVQSSVSTFSSQTLSNQSAATVTTQIGRSRYKVFQYQNKAYETSTIITLPSGQMPLEAKNVAKAKPKVEVAQAAANTPVQLTLFCATDACITPNNPLANYGSVVQAFYKTQVGKVYNLNNPTATVTGIHPTSWYTTCHNANSLLCPLQLNPNCQISPTGCTPSTPKIGEPLLNAYVNIAAEKGYYTISIDNNGVVSGNAIKRPTTDLQYILGFTTGNRFTCGATIPGEPYGIVDPTSEGYGFNCSTDVTNQDYLNSAHELGHSFGLQHTAGSVGADGLPNGGIMAYDDEFRHLFPDASYLRADQVTALQTSTYFHANTGNIIANLLKMTTVFSTTSAGNVVARWKSGNMGWSGWGTIAAGGAAASSVSTAASGRGDLHLFARNAANNLIHASYTNYTWSPPPWQNLGGGILNYPASVSWGPNRYDVFARGTNNHLYQKFWNGSAWSPFVDFGGTLSAAPAVASQGVNRLEVFLRNQNNAIEVKTWNGTVWSAFKSLGGNQSTAPAAVSWGPNHDDVFALNSANHLVVKTYDNGTWTATWKDLGLIPNGAAGYAPTVTSPAAGQLTLFAKTTTSTVTSATYNNGVLSAWTDYGNGSVTSSPAAISWR